MWFIAVATIPAAIAGAPLPAMRSPTTSASPGRSRSCSRVFAILLWLADRTPQRRTMSDLGLRHGVVMGFAQCLALMPGVSRSGITITAGGSWASTGTRRPASRSCCWYPTVFGAALWTGVKDVLLGDLPPGWKGPFVVGILAAAGSGLLAIHWLLGYVRRHNYTVFVVYRLVIALVIVLLIVSGAYKATF